MVIVYHRVPRNMRGTILHPLNAMKKLEGYEEVFAQQAQKYLDTPITGESREWLMQRKVGTLDCLWNDVIHMAAVHPLDLRDAIVESGCAWFEGEWFMIDATRLDKSRLCVYRALPDIPESEQCTDLSIRHIVRYARVPQHAKEYFRQVAQHAAPEKGNPLLFVGIPHIFYKGSIETKGCERVRV